uniref:Uncharacterized protein n=1 Tax=Giardia intestinalis TaxID=5741 RepID=Q95W99_GIAIN|nr:unknown [Giardia intestinalis]|eukprot:XP_001705819.1 Calmodulin antisense orf [Giardia lamblia ATCC 50803]
MSPRLIYLLQSIFTKSAYLIWPSPSMSASRRRSSTSSSSSFSPMWVRTCLSSAALTYPSPFLSKTRKASLSSSSESVLRDFVTMSRTNSTKLITPLPSVSMELIISARSASVGFCPRERITVPSSAVVMFPSPFLSKRLKASLNSSRVSWGRFIGMSPSICYVL